MLIRYLIIPMSSASHR